MKFAYQRNGAPILSWKRAAPHQSRAADARSLGAFNAGRTVLRARDANRGGVLRARDANRGGSVPMLSQPRGAITSLGSLGGDTLDAMPLPVPGGPEPIGGLGCATCTAESPSNATKVPIAVQAVASPGQAVIKAVTGREVGAAVGVAATAAIVGGVYHLYKRSKRR